MSESAAGAPSGVDLDSLSLDQLSQLRQQEESRLQSLTSRYQQLRAARAKLATAKSSLSSVGPSTADAQIMVPLTASLYCPGKIKDPNKVMVELGTGFYMERTAKDANAFLDRRIRLVDANSENVMKVVQATQGNVRSIADAMQGKMLEIRARQEGMRVRQRDAAAAGGS
mmetsp:Transcript_544/g.1662  ORF Transcript_544/g.1662 Transcript_544/m.1662 type:complete len:170 (-) Transcript_544:541-1050(-)|eukprot:CAMPEP_0113546624 /NCGR_PEP_ID=MMETSP0015_2-20120614/11906_1 /TAXON_ID=2838 /ORGANISM="Odontella" /LENGTH=169 /DNA_ID=CAMNT_0000447093 /DNA_START=164 /DNA_END=673 /DNA_ORIENTATION=+ /assembly_acc=CAM_ASM_000160